jgi:pre-rRNA-processing protein TSR4
MLLLELKKATTEEELNMQRRWFLGYCESPNQTHFLQRHWFPCKVSGKPAWLHPGQIPILKQLRCRITDNPLSFLLQICAPFEGKATGFHRIISVFLPYKGSLIGKPGAVRVFRSQLCEFNQFYYSASLTNNIYTILGIDTHILFESMQKDPWGVLTLEVIARGTDIKITIGEKTRINTTNQEYELIVEDNGSEDIKKKTQEITEKKMCYTSEDTINDLNDPISIEQEQFEKFRAAIDMEPNQVIRCISIMALTNKCS